MEGRRNPIAALWAASLGIKGGEGEAGAAEVAKPPPPPIAVHERDSDSEIVAAGTVPARDGTQVTSLNRGAGELRRAADDSELEPHDSGRRDLLRRTSSVAGSTVRLIRPSNFGKRTGARLCLRLSCWARPE